MYSFVFHAFTVGKKAGEATPRAPLPSNWRGIGGIFPSGCDIYVRRVPPCFIVCINVIVSLLLVMYSMSRRVLLNLRSYVINYMCYIYAPS